MKIKMDWDPAEDSETSLKRKVLRWLFKEFPTAFIYKTSDKWTSGIPDIYMLNDGISYWIELKRKGKKPTKLQSYNIDRLRKAGAIAFWADNIEEIKRRICERTNIK